MIAEEYVEGRELYVGVVGNQRLHTLSDLGADLDQLPEGAPRIATAKVKWDEKYQKKHKISSHRAQDLPAGSPKRSCACARASTACCG